MSKNPPGAPQKAPPKFILPSNPFYPNKQNENLNNENLETVEEMSENNLQRLVKETLNSPGNTNPKYSPSILNLKVPKMKLPNHLRGGKRKTHRKRRHTKRKHTRKH